MKVRTLPFVPKISAVVLMDFSHCCSSSDGTGVARYWRSRLASTIESLAVTKGISAGEAKAIIQQKFCLIEAGAYHSKSSPGAWMNELPSSLMARRYVHEYLLPLAQNGQIMLFVWRCASFWGLEDTAPQVIIRPPLKAQLKNVFAEERQAIVNFLAKH